MKIAIWIIAICEVIRIAQNQMQLNHFKHSEKNQDTAYAEFIKSLKKGEKEFVEELIREYDKEHENGN